MRRVALALAALIALPGACGDDSADAPSPARIDTPLPELTAPASVAQRTPDFTPMIASAEVAVTEVAPTHSVLRDILTHLASR